MDVKTVFRDLVLPVAMMSGFGAFFWGIRGTGGYGGSMGGLFAGTGWAVLWYFISNDDKVEGAAGGARSLASRWAILALGIGIMVGGFHGYGQFNSWIKGSWTIQPGTPVDVDPAWGFLGLLQCGLSWGGTAGALLGWAAPGSGDWRRARFTWVIRTAFGLTGALFGLVFAMAFPGLLMPLYGSSYYSDLAACPQCTRAIQTAISSSVQFGLFAGFLAAEIVLKNWRGVATSAIMAAGFGAGFVFGSGWFFVSLPGSWKAWEMTIGAVGGASIGVTHFVANRRVVQGEPGLFTVTERVFQAPASYEVVFGHNLPLALGMSISLFNGMKPADGFAENFFAGDAAATSVVMGFTYAAIAAMWVFFALSVVFTFVSSLRGKRWFGRPLVQVLVIQGILVTIGFMTTLVPVVPLPAGVAFVAGTYIVGLAIGGGALAGMAVIDRFTKRSSV
ncbi:MAG: hypothetical protein JW839_15665 [Candidatus Lokiarchaeota archaeon]|nr:hypothetical protein [Candidatus Lokiarchaeota archaeon]